MKRGLERDQNVENESRNRVLFSNNDSGRSPLESYSEKQKDEADSILRLFFEPTARGFTRRRVFEMLGFLRSHPGIIDSQLVAGLDSEEEWKRVLSTYLYLETSGETIDGKLERLGHNVSPWIRSEVVCWLYRKQEFERYNRYLTQILDESSDADLLAIFQLVNQKQLGSILQTGAASMLGVGIFKERLISDLTANQPRMAKMASKVLRDAENFTFDDRKLLLYAYSENPFNGIEDVIKSSVFDQKLSDNFRWYSLQAWVYAARPEVVLPVLESAALNREDRLQSDYLKAIDGMQSIEQRKTIKVKKLIDQISTDLARGSYPNIQTLRELRNLVISGDVKSFMQDVDQIAARVKTIDNELLLPHLELLQADFTKISQ